MRKLNNCKFWRALNAIVFTACSCERARCVLVLQLRVCCCLVAGCPTRCYSVHRICQFAVRRKVFRVG